MTDLGPNRKRYALPSGSKRRTRHPEVHLLTVEKRPRQIDEGASMFKKSVASGTHGEPPVRRRSGFRG